MSIQGTLPERIVAAVGTGFTPPELTVLQAATGAVIASGTTFSKITDASVAHSINATFSNTEVASALNALGVKINLLIDAIEAFKISSSS